jgi:hypothetical protein
MLTGLERPKGFENFILNFFQNEIRMKGSIK